LKKDLEKIMIFYEKNKKCEIIILDEVNVKIQNLETKDKKILREKFRIFNPSAKYNPYYTIGKWDGYENFFHLSGKTYLNLLDEILQYLYDNNYEIEIEDRRKKYNFKFEKIDEYFLKNMNVRWDQNHLNGGEFILLRDYQVEAINSFLDRLTGIKEIPTGAGKTIIIACLAKILEKYGRTITIVPSKSLILQTKKDFDLLKLDTGLLYGDQKDIENKHIISTWQSLESINKMKKIAGEDLLRNFSSDIVAVIVDECHAAKAKVLQNILSGPFSHIPIRIGITATVPRTKLEYIPLKCCIGEMIDQIEIQELQKKGILSECEIKIYQSDDKGKVFPNYQSELQYLYKDENRIKKLVDLINEIRKTGNTLVLVDRISTGENLEKNIENSVFIKGKTKVKERMKEFESFSFENDKLLIATFGICSTGINIPRIFNLVMIEPGKSFIKIIQSIGRGIRKAKDKKKVIICDICSTTKYSNKHMKERIKYYNSAGFKYDITKI
jgi:superfamily II DNA or RNA helicase